MTSLVVRTSIFEPSSRFCRVPRKEPAVTDGISKAGTAEDAELRQLIFESATDFAVFAENAFEEIAHEGADVIFTPGVPRSNGAALLAQA
jgi:hypothetical protein